jgi:hypothetical protein
MDRPKFWLIRHDILLTMLDEIRAGMLPQDAIALLEEHGRTVSVPIQEEDAS